MRLKVHTAILLATLMVIPCGKLSAKTLHGSATITSSSAGTPVAKAWAPTQASIHQADALASAYKLDSAEQIYRRLLKLNPKNAAAWNGLGKVAFYRTQSSNQNLRNRTDSLHAEAIQHFLTAIRYQPGYVEAHVNLAKVYMAQGRNFLANEAINKALSLSPNNAGALAAQGQWYLSQSRYQEALRVLQKASQKRPSDAGIKSLLAKAYIGCGDLDTAHKVLQTALAKEPSVAQAFFQAGRLYEQQGNDAAAEEAYRKAIAIKPEWPEARIGLVDFYEKHGDFRAAASQLKSLVDSGVAEWPIINRIGKLSVKSGQPDVAVHYYRKWLDAHPEDIKAQEGLSYAKRELARQKFRNDDLISQGEAKRYAEQALQYNPENYEARLIAAKLDREIGVTPPKKEPGMVDVALAQTDYRSYQSFERGELLLERYQFAQADYAFRQARLSDVSPRGQMVLGELLLTKGLPQLAEESFSQVLAMLPGNASAQLGLAKAREAREKSDELVLVAKKNKPEQAVRQAREALKLNVKNAEAYRILARAAEASQRYGEAADYYYACRELTQDPAEARELTRKIEQLKRKIAKS